MDIKKIFVAGAGLMGGGITQVCAQAGYNVTMRDISDEIIEKSLKAIHSFTLKREAAASSHTSRTRAGHHSTIPRSNFHNKKHESRKP